MEDIKDRILRLEIEVEALYKSVERLSASAIALQKEVGNIQKNLTQIKYFAMGAVVIMTFDKVGLFKAVSLMLGGV